jgi:hypothetical protein
MFLMKFLNSKCRESIFSSEMSTSQDLRGPDDILKKFGFFKSIHEASKHQKSSPTHVSAHSVPRCYDVICPIDAYSIRHVPDLVEAM